MSRNFSKSRDWDDKRRGHPVYVLERKRWPLDSTVSMQSEIRTVEMRRAGGGGHWDGRTGDGEAWRALGWFVHTAFERPIKGGKWAGPWQRDPAGS
jgi:hypothetical protein